MSQTKLDPRLLDSAVALPAMSGAALTGISAGFTQGTEQSTASGSSVTFSGIPAGVQMIIVNLAGVSITAADNMKLQIGDAGGIETSAYSSSATNIANGVSPSTSAIETTGYSISCNDAAMALSGQAILTLEDAASFTWACSHSIHMGTARVMLVGAGLKSLSAELTQLSLVPDSGTFDAGAMNIMYL